jgi:hypothetical protein
MHGMAAGLLLGKDNHRHERGKSEVCGNVHNQPPNNSEPTTLSNPDIKEGCIRASLDTVNN